MDYSHTRIGTFEKCKRHYYYRYILKPEGAEIFDNTISKFLGSMVHETLEHLYRRVLDCNIPTKEQLKAYFDFKWDSEYDPNIIIDKDHEGDPGYYRAMGWGYIEKYYRRHEPFRDMDVLSLEETFYLDLPGGNRYTVKMDKLARKGDDIYVCDYKTDKRLKTQEEADADRQLAMYSLWVRKQYPDAKRVRLLWHMLRFDTDVVSDRTEEQLVQLQDRVVSTISEIEAMDRDDIDAWVVNPTNLCDWCEYKRICPEFKHEESLPKDDPVAFAEDDGVRMVDEITELKERRSRLKEEKDGIDERIASLEADIAEFCNQRGISAVVGTTQKASVTRELSVRLPDANKDAAKETVMREGLIEYMQINTSSLYSNVRKGTAPESLFGLVETEDGVKVSLRKRTSKGR